MKIAAMKTIGIAVFLLFAAGFALLTPSMAADESPLKADSFKHYVEEFNRVDKESIVNAIPNTSSLDWLIDNIPRFECPDKLLEKTYYFRWWVYRKHIRKTPEGFVVTEFLPPVSWGKAYNTINCPAGHHIYEGRWLRDPKYMDDYETFYFNGSGNPGGVDKGYSNWLADAVYARFLVDANKDLAVSLLPGMVRNYEAWTKDKNKEGERSRLLPNGLYWQIDSWDGMEWSIGGSGARPTINSYMYGDALAIAKTAELAGKKVLAQQYRDKAAAIKTLIQQKLWNSQDQFFETRDYDGCNGNYGNDPSHDNNTLVGVREEVGFIPWYFNLPDAQYSVAWKQLSDPQGFSTKYGLTTAEQRHPRFLSEEGGCRWNGQVWPYATTQTLVALANLLNNYKQNVVSKQDYFNALQTYAGSQYANACDPQKPINTNSPKKSWIGETSSPKDGRWLTGGDTGKDYNHSGFADLVISGLVGLRPRSDNTVEVNPLIPEGTWDYFCLDKTPYHGRVMTILYDKTGEHYSKGKGLRVFADGRLIAGSESLQRVTGTLPPPADAASSLAKASVVEKPKTTTRNSHYAGNREPLAPSPLVKLPIGSVTPRGWLRHQLELERDGMTGRLAEVSAWLDFAKVAWANKDGVGSGGWEELPYWLKGYGDLGYVLKDDAVIAQARKWIEAVMNSQREDGWFGPRDMLAGLGGKPDLWPNMVMLNVFQSYHEATGDPRALEVMKRYLKWENTLPESAFGEGYWPKLRAGDNIESALWLYNRTGEPWLLELAKKIHRGMARWNHDIVDWHNVNIAQGFRAGTLVWPLSRDANDLQSAERNYQKVMSLYGQQPGGTFVGDENCRPGYLDPRGGFETCGIVEFMHSFELLTRATGQPIWADRCEEIALNSFPAAMTPDQKGLHYLTAVNQVQLDSKNKSPGVQNGGTMFSHSPFEVYRCCQHNVSHGWPYYAEEMWLATADNGLCASLYAASEVTAKVAGGVKATIHEETDYPFNDTITFKLTLPESTRFPLYLRVPQWCDGASVEINGTAVDVKPKPLSFIVLDRQWKNGDVVTLHLPMQIAIRRWPKNCNAASVSYGPLAFSLAIKEHWAKYGNRNAKWPEWEAFPESAWNYGLVLDAKEPAKSFELMREEGPVAANPFTADAAPLRLKAKAKKIPGWKMDQNNMIGKLRQSPIVSTQPVEEISLIPLGAARLRLGMFPVVGDGADAQEWPAMSASASHCGERDSIDALSDGQTPSGSNDQSIPRFTWWPRQGGEEWVQYEFASPRKISRASVYWFDDTPAGGCGLPQSWRLLYRQGTEWKAVRNAKIAPITKDAWNTMSFDPVETSALRLEVQLKANLSGGILEWRVSDGGI